MPLPFLIPGIITYVAVKKAHARGKKQGRDEATEEYSATVNELKNKLQKMQRQREKTKNGFKEVINGIAEIETNDANFFSKVASLSKGYTQFHLYVITCISYCRYQILQKKIPKRDSDELKDIVLGLVQTGFPDNLKNEVDIVWQCKDKDQVLTTYHKYKGKLNKNLKLSIEDTILKLNEYLQGYAELSSQTRKFEKEIAAAS